MSAGRVASLILGSSGLLWVVGSIEQWKEDREEERENRRELPSLKIGLGSNRSPVGTTDYYVAEVVAQNSQANLVCPQERSGADTKALYKVLDLNGDHIPDVSSRAVQLQCPPYSGRCHTIREIWNHKSDNGVEQRCDQVTTDIDDYERRMFERGLKGWLRVSELLDNIPQATPAPKRDYGNSFWDVSGQISIAGKSPDHHMALVPLERTLDSECNLYLIDSGYEDPNSCSGDHRLIGAFIACDGFSVDIPLKLIPNADQLFAEGLNLWGSPIPPLADDD